MEITEKTDQRLVLQKRTLMIGIVIGAFAVISLLFLVLTAIQGIMTVIRIGYGDAFGRIFILMLYLLVGLVFVAVGTVAGWTVSKGLVLTFDKMAETVTIDRAHLLRVRTITHPIYGVSHIDIQPNEEIGVYGLFLVLRSGERIPLATEPLHQDTHVRDVADTVRHFLRGEFPTRRI